MLIEAELPKYYAKIYTDKGIFKFRALVARETIYFPRLIATEVIRISYIVFEDSNGERIGFVGDHFITMSFNDDAILVCLPWVRIITITNKKGKIRQFKNIIALKQINKKWAQKAYNLLMIYQEEIKTKGHYNLTNEYSKKLSLSYSIY